MKVEKHKSLKIHPDLHRVLKVHCAEVSCPLQDFVNSTLNTALPPLYRIDFTKKKKKGK